MRENLKGFVVVLMVLGLLGCSTTTQLTRPSPPILRAAVAPGDSVSVLTRDGNRHEFEVDSVTDDEIRGTGVSIRFGDIEDMRVTRFSTGKTAAAGLGGIGLVAVALGAIFVIKTFEDGFGD